MESLVVVNSANELLRMGSGSETDALKVSICVVAVEKTFGENLIRSVGNNDSLVFSLQPYEVNLGESSISALILITFATCTVALGAWFATADLRPRSTFASAFAPQHGEVAEINGALVAGFCCGGSLVLVILFFLMAYLVYVVIICFALGGFTCFVQFGSMFLRYVVPGSKKQILAMPSCVLTISDLVAVVPSAVLVVVWVVWRNETYAWPLQDLIGVGFLCMIQRTLRLPNMRLATLLLGVMFFYDIFWVFLSPLLFGTSVMVHVAKGGTEVMPLLLRIPATGDPSGGPMLGFGDVALPGLLLSYLRRFDLLHPRPVTRGYFAPVLVCYFIGLIMAFFALTVMKMGQPALLYLVPMTLLPTFLLGSCRKDLSALWHGSATSLNNEAREGFAKYEELHSVKG